MVELKWTQEAEASLRDIHDYIARDRPATARRTTQSILNWVESLTGLPNRRDQTYPYLPEHPIRILTYGQFQIAYLVQDENTIAILGVFHGLIFLPLK